MLCLWHGGRNPSPGPAIAMSRVSYGDQARCQGFKVARKAVDIIVPRAFHDDQFDRSSSERCESLAVRQRNASILAAMDQDDRHFHTADDLVRAQRVLEQPFGSQRPGAYKRISRGCMQELSRSVQSTSPDFRR
jgi:hypothetical protein